MKNSIKKSVAILMLLAFLVSSKSIAQVKKRRCATAEAIEHRLQTDSAFRADYMAKQNDLDAYQAAHPVFTTEAFPNDTIIIPVVAHIVLPNPYRVTDENVQFFIDRLNEDFSGFNADSTVGASWYSVRGHSAIRFRLARRDPNNNATTGIERKVGNIQIAQTTAQPIKTVAGGGLAPWNINLYYNIWIGSGYSTSGLLGISPQIGPGTQSGSDIDGVCVDEQVFANNPCYSDPSFALARTAIHEIGHNFGLCHTFQGGCGDADFSTNITSTGKSLSSAFLKAIDDTPPLSQSTSGCPATGTTNGCTPSVPKMFENYMDYSDDPCMNLFTIGQVKRMHQVVSQFRSGYLTTQGYKPPAGTPNDDAGMVEIISPGGYEFEQASCLTRTYTTPTCGAAPTITPRVKINNPGVNDLTSITINVSVNGSIAATQTFTTLVKGGRTEKFTLPIVTLSPGVNVVKFYTTNPNGNPDGATKNDTITKTITITDPTILPPVTTFPFFEGFENTAFDPTSNGWKVVNPSFGSTTWARTTATYKTGTACAWINMFGYTPVGEIDYLKSPRFNFDNIVDSVFVTFNYAYRVKSTSAAVKRDTLSLEVATDCEGTNWTPLWKKGGDALRTITSPIGTTWTPAVNEWTTTPVKVSLWNYKSMPIYLAFKSKNGNGQNLYLDDINVYAKGPVPVKLISFKLLQNNKSVVCKWETANEVNLKNFSVERSTDGHNFEAIGTVNSTGLNNGSASYSFDDKLAYTQNSKVLYYRLKSNDDNGKYSYSDVLYVKLGEKHSLLLYPNPAVDYVTLKLNNTTNEATTNTIEIVDYLGRVVLQKHAIVNSGVNNYTISTAGLQKGNYVMIVKGNAEVSTIKFTKE